VELACNGESTTKRTRSVVKARRFWTF
jgi:hypothetical protein